MKPTRSALFVPGNRPKWITNAATHGADLVIIDLEDAVPPDETAAARDDVADAIPTVRDDGQRIFVRINGHPNSSADRTVRDLEAIVPREPNGLVVPKVESAADIEQLETVLTHIERRDGLTVGATELLVTIETAQAMKHVYDICLASERVTSVMCGATKGTDTNRALRFEWTGPGRQGLETLHMRQKALLDARAAGIDYPLAGPYVDIEDLDGLTEDMEFAREMGYEGYVVIHPSHVDPANDCFTPDDETVEYWIGLYGALRDAIDRGESAIRYRGEMVDTANLETAREHLRRAAVFRDELDDDVAARLTDLEYSAD
ncbi:CoA ester lyase [Natrinema sp. SYSU A 869]|uniref:HpcH/HpaI aldolase/citrate lyase family protein n=1 Tax=Natrinema sp. SYSU A 869 TaxID=2871694 RepID=UPI001CA3AE01|nr:CoA ester lyase [Natrinema sp. SYSU A 869]